MKTYTVKIPMSGRLTFTVKAKSKEKAEEVAWDEYNENGVDHDTLELEDDVDESRGRVVTVEEVTDEPQSGEQGAS